MKTMLSAIALIASLGAAHAADLFVEQPSPFTESMAETQDAAAPMKAEDLNAPATQAENDLMVNAVRAKLRDPYSAVFSAKAKFVREPGHRMIICGLVNGKNGYGGYAGDERYAVILSPEDNGALLGDVADTACADKGLM